MKRFSLLISLAAGLFAVVAVSLYISAREAALLEQVALQDVVVATRDILQNTVVDERLVELSQVPQKYLQPGAVTSLADAIGRVAVVPVPTGAQLLGPGLLGGGRVGLAFEVPRGMRAVTVAANDVSGVAGLIQPGNFIDLIGTFEYGRPTGVQGGQMTYADERTETLTLAQNVQVVAVGAEFQGRQAVARTAFDDPEAEAEVAAEMEMAAGAEAISMQNVTVLVAPQQVQELVLAQQVGTISMSLRSALDIGEIITLERLDPFKMLGVQVPVKPRARPTWREIRGTER